MTGDQDPRSDPPEEWRACWVCGAINPWRPEGCTESCLTPDK